MRCPKCGYTSFDDLEVCNKCHKNILGMIGEITGTSFHCPPPAFLRATPQVQSRGRSAPTTQPPEIARAERGEAMNEIEMDDNAAFLMEDLSMDETAAIDIKTTAAQPEREITMDIDGLDEIAPRDEFTLDLDADRDRNEIKMPSLDFGDLDISDLAPPTEGMERQTEEEKPIVRQPRKEQVADASVSVPATGAVSASPLEDLQFSDLNLDAPTKLAATTTTGKKYLPSVKTGTALDNFDINLGELFAEPAETKK